MVPLPPAPLKALPGARIALALAFLLMLSDYLVRSVMAGVLPLVKAEWGLSDGELGLLLSIVPLLVGLLAWPVSLLADRWGYVRSITAMALVWCGATIGCGLAQSHVQLLLARAAVGAGEAAYGSAGGALIASFVPPQRRAASLGFFASAAVLGTVLGVAFGGVVAAQFGWRSAFMAAGAGSLALVVAFRWLVREPPKPATPVPARSLTADARTLLVPRSARLLYIAAGLQFFVPSVVAAWLPTWFTRAYDMAPDAAAVRAAAVFLVLGVGTVAGGFLADRISARQPDRKCLVLASYALATFAFTTLAFVVPPGGLQMLLLCCGALFMTSTAGVSNSAILDVTPTTLRATALATGVLSANLLGLAPGAWVAGHVSDRFGLATALALAPLPALLAAALFAAARATYRRDADVARATA
jgi:predicted MFS family arabinose efflux permease